MANHKSAEKRIRQNVRRRQVNKSILSELGTLEKKVRSFLQKKEKDLALQTLKVFNSKMDRSLRQGILHKNKVNRKKSQLTILVNQS